MNERQIKLIAKTLGSDFISDLKECEICGVDGTKIELQIVPRTVLAYLVLHLKGKEVGSVSDLDLPFAENTKLNVTKFSKDNYSGKLIQGDKEIAQFKYKTLAGLGLILMSSLELYDIDQLKVEKQPEEKGLQALIEEKLYLHALISDVIEKKLSQRDAIKQLVDAKLNQSVVEANEPKEAEEPEQTIEIEVPDKKSKLRAFMEKRESNKVRIIDKLQKSEIKCPDCKTTMYDGKDSIRLCICYGEHRNKEIKIQKGENDRIKLQFPKDIEIEGIDMLLDTIKNK